MEHLDRGYVVPVWAPMGPLGWVAGWLHPRHAAFVLSALPSQVIPLRRAVRPRDPNRAGEGDRPG